MTAGYGANDPSGPITQGTTIVSRQGAVVQPPLKAISSHIVKVLKTELYPASVVIINGQASVSTKVSTRGYGECDLPDGTEKPIIIPYLTTVMEDDFGEPIDGGPDDGDQGLNIETTPQNDAIFGMNNFPDSLNRYQTDSYGGDGLATDAYGTYDYTGQNGTHPAKATKDKHVRKPKHRILRGKGLTFTTTLAPDETAGTSDDPNNNQDNKGIGVDLADNGGLVFGGADSNGVAINLKPDSGLVITQNQLAALVDGVTITFDDNGALRAASGVGVYLPGRAIVMNVDMGSGGTGSASGVDVNVEIASVSGAYQAGLCDTGGDDQNGLMINLASQGASGGASGGGAGLAPIYPAFLPVSYKSQYADGHRSYTEYGDAEDNPHEAGTLDYGWWNAGYFGAKAQGRRATLFVSGDGGDGGGGGGGGGALAGGGATLYGDVFGGSGGTFGTAFPTGATCSGALYGSGLTIVAGDGNSLAVWLAQVGAANVSGLGFGGDDGEGLLVQIASPSGLVLTPTGLSIELADSASSGGSGSSGGDCDGNGSGLTITAGTDGNGLAVLADPSGAICVGSAGIAAIPDKKTIIINGKDQLQAVGLKAPTKPPTPPSNGSGTPTGAPCTVPPDTITPPSGGGTPPVPGAQPPPTGSNTGTTTPRPGYNCDGTSAGPWTLGTLVNNYGPGSLVASDTDSTIAGSTISTVHHTDTTGAAANTGYWNSQMKLEITADTGSVLSGDGARFFMCTATLNAALKSDTGSYRVQVWDGNNFFFGDEGYGLVFNMNDHTWYYHHDQTFYDHIAALDGKTTVTFAVWKDCLDQTMLFYGTPAELTQLNAVNPAGGGGVNVHHGNFYVESVAYGIPAGVGNIATWDNVMCATAIPAGIAVHYLDGTSYSGTAPTPPTGSVPPTQTPAYQQGWADSLAGVSSSECPYLDDSCQYWSLGWTDAYNYTHSDAPIAGGTGSPGVYAPPTTPPADVPTSYQSLYTEGYQAYLDGKGQVCPYATDSDPKKCVYWNQGWTDGYNAFNTKQQTGAGLAGLVSGWLPGGSSGSQTCLQGSGGSAGSPNGTDPVSIQGNENVTGDITASGCVIAQCLTIHGDGTIDGKLSIGGVDTLPTGDPTADGQVMVSSAGAIIWENPPWLVNPLTGVGDLIVGTGGGAAGRLPAGTTGKILGLVGTPGSAGTPSWVNQTSINGLTGALSIVHGTGISLSTSGATITVAVDTSTFPASVTSLNGETGDLTIAGTGGIAVTQSGTTITIDGSGVTGGGSGSAITWRGAYNGAAAYVANDAVAYNGSSWIALGATTGNAPVVGAYWDLLAAKGSTGDTGPTGPIGITWLGAWSSTHSYVIDDAVYYNGASYIATQASLNVTPTTGAPFWSVLVGTQAGIPFSTLSDVAIVSPANGDFVRYNLSTGKWYNTSTIPLGSLDGAGASTGNAVIWNGSAWTPGVLSGGGGGVATATSTVFGTVEVDNAMSGAPRAVTTGSLTPAGTTGAPTSGTYYTGQPYVDSGYALYVCTAGGTPGTWQKISSGGPFDVASFVPGQPFGSQLVLSVVTPGNVTALTLPANMAGAVGKVGVSPLGTTIYSVQKNGAAIGTISISPAGVFSFATTGGAAVTFASGDELSVVAPSAQDPALTDVRFTLSLTRS